MALFQDFGHERIPWTGFVGAPYYGPVAENVAASKDQTTNGPIIVEVEASELGLNFHGKSLDSLFHVRSILMDIDSIQPEWVRWIINPENSFYMKLKGAKSEFTTKNIERPQFVQPNCLKSNRTYNRRLGSKSYLIDEGSEATTTKTTSTRSKPWREVNDEIAARMMAASSDSPPLIPRRDYEDGGQFGAKKTMMKNRPRPPASYNTTSECSSTDDCKNLIDSNRRHPFEYQQQLTLYKGPNFEPGIDAVPMPMPMPYDANGYPCHMMPPPGPAFMGPMDFPQDPAFMGGVPPFQGDFMPPPPMMPMMPPTFMPPMMHSQDFESFTLHKQKKVKNKKMKRRSHSMEALPPPMFGMPPQFFGPPMGAPVPGPWGCPQMPPFLANNGPLALEYPGANNEQETGRYQLPQTPIMPNGGPFTMPPPPPPPPMAMNPCMDDVPPTTTYHQLGGAFDQKISKSAEADIFNEKELYKKEKVDYASCCKNFSEVLWIIIGIVLFGLILGLVLGLTLV